MVFNQLFPTHVGVILRPLPCDTWLEAFSHTRGSVPHHPTGAAARMRFFPHEWEYTFFTVKYVRFIFLFPTCVGTLILI